MGNVVFSFDEKKNKKIKNIKNILGGKGANLAEMGRLGLPVPPGFTISTEVCDIFYNNKKKLPNNIIKAIDKELKKIEKNTKKKFGDLKKSSLSISQVWRKNIDARDDGYNFKFRFK